MGAYTGNYSRDMNDPRNRYIKDRLQVGVPYVDADHNDQYDMSFNNIRSLILGVTGDGSPNNGFKVVGTGATNDFTINGGDGTFAGAGRLYFSGYNPFLYSDITYLGTPVIGLAGEDQRAIHSKITATIYSSGTNETTITDSAKNYVVNELAGRTFIPDIAIPATTFPIVSNTATQIVVTGDATATGPINSRYRLNLTTPAGARTDGVYVDIYEDEIDSVEDTNLLHSLSTNIEAQRRIRLEHSIFVREDIVTNGEFASYTDSDGNQHFVNKIAEIARLATDATITVGMVTDLRKSIILGGANDIVGTTKLWPTASSPTGWLLCDGTSYATANFPDLFTLIAYTFGGSGANFNIPDLKNRMAIGQGITFPTIGATGGSTTKNISHTHTIPNTLGAGSHNHGGATGTGGAAEPMAGGSFSHQNVWHTHTIPTQVQHTHGMNPTNLGGLATQDVMNPYIILNYIIKF